ncbi:S8 family serine peptidase [Polyangium sp. y55x31]|uniref:S8 family serine peptidase n=1 Tax=Polyangium sp. y55x31 TaxID=3042688 RepID=UPI002482457C|nr:S8 family serine peptidase [Polyangium sp. y55x31]MDI1482363.1 S8 family serine peptidase [Polyangium sp. y55x31]
MRARPLFAFAAALPLILLSAAFAHAEGAPARSLVRLLHKPTKVHPLADNSGRVAVSVALPPGKDARSLGLLEVAPGVGAIRLAPDEIDTFAAAHPDLALTVSPPLTPLLDVSGTWTRVEAFRAATGLGTGSGVVVGIIDTGLDVAHPDFRTATGKTRVAWMLQAGRDPVGLHPEIEERFGCTASTQSKCAVFSGADLDAMMSGQSKVDLPRDPAGHGTHVAGIAAGNGGLMDGGTPKYVGIAPEATLVIASPSAEGKFDETDILNAARFIFEVGEELGLPTVVNLSVGGDFGPHDGTSPSEKGLAALVGDDKPGRAIVVAAGNSGTLYGRDDRGPFGIHTEVRVTPGAEVRVPIATPASKRGHGYVWITFRPGDEVSVGLEGPGGSSWIRLVDPGDELGYSGDDNTTAAVINRLVNGKTPMTAETNSAVVAFSGAWDEGAFTIRLSGHGDAHLWVTGQGDVSPSGGSGLAFEKAVRQGTIAIPASHPNLLAVGCTLNRIGWDPLTIEPIELVPANGIDWKPDDVCYFSAAGPTPFGVAKPEISAPGGFIAAAMSRDADPRLVPGGLFDGAGCPKGEPCYVVDERHAVTAGTSMSAPHVAGAVALLFELDRNRNGGQSTLTQARVTELLQAGARWPTGTVRHETQLGVGALDLEGARRAFEEEQGPSGPPSVEKSWWVLSSAYARPDETWPVWGTIELRREDGEIASGIAGTELELSVTGGVVLQPITKVRHGLFRFAVAGERGSAGSKMVVDVRFAGRSIESPRELAIGEDVWRANGTLDATSGGCAWADEARTSSRSPLGPSIGVALAGIGLWRRRSRKNEGSSTRARSDLDRA